MDLNIRSSFSDPTALIRATTDEHGVAVVDEEIDGAEHGEDGLGDDDFVNELEEYGADLEQPSLSARARKPCRRSSTVDRVSDENTAHREPRVLADGRYVCPYCDIPYKNRKSYMTHKLQIHKVVERVRI